MSKVRDVLSTAATAILVVCAVIVTALVVMREISGPQTASAQAFRRVQDWEALTREGSVLGARDAKVELVVFSDFQCPFCAQVVTDLDRLLERHQGQVAVVFRHFPIENIHPHARAAAGAAECAGAQGRFRAFHDALFAGQAQIGKREWVEFARTAQVPSLDEFQQCVREQRFDATVQRDLAVAAELGVNSTPTFIFDGVLTTGGPGLKMIEERVEAAARP